MALAMDRQMVSSRGIMVATQRESPIAEVADGADLRLGIEQGDVALQSGSLIFLGFVQLVYYGSHGLTERHAEHGLSLLRAAIPEEPVEEGFLKSFLADGLHIKLPPLSC